MDRPQSQTTIPIEVAAAVAGARLVGAPTSGKDDEWAAAGYGAIRVARAIGARLALADVSTRSWFTSPYSSGDMTADTEGLSAGEGAVGREELELLGRHYLVAQLDEAAAVGVQAVAWLATKPGIRSLPLFLERFPDIDVLVAPPLHHPSLQQWLGGDTISGVRARIGDRALIHAHPDGRLTVDRPMARGRSHDRGQASASSIEGFDSHHVRA
jgi:hypothetical protein